MKRKLLLLVILLIEALFICAGVFQTFADALNPSLPFIVKCGKDILKHVDKLSELTHLSSKITSVNLSRLIVLAAINIIFICVYFGIFALIITLCKNRKRKIRRKAKVTQYVLTPEEEKNYEWKLYVRKFPTKRIISLIIPLFSLFIFVIIRFDRQVCVDSSSHLNGFTNLYHDTFIPFFNKFGYSFGLKMIDFFTNSKGSGYIDLMNRLFNTNIAWIEYIILGLGIIIVLLLWWGVFSLFAKLFRKHNAKKKAKNAREKYINRMEEIEYKARKKEKNKMSVKAEDMLVPPTPEPQKNDVQLIASIPEQQDKQVDTKTLKRQADYIDDISSGVIDLGVVKKEEEVTKPIIERETTFVGDKDVDIVLEEEPVIEVVEEEAIDEFDNNEEDDPFFEKYQPEYVDTSKIEAFLDKEQVEVHEEGYEELEDEKPQEESVTIKEYVEPQTENEKLQEDMLKPEDVKNQTDVLSTPIHEESLSQTDDTEEKQTDQTKDEVKEEIKDSTIESTNVDEAKTVSNKEVKTQPLEDNAQPEKDSIVEDKVETSESIEKDEQPKVEEIAGDSFANSASEELLQSNEKIESDKEIEPQEKEDNTQLDKDINVEEKNVEESTNEKKAITSISIPTKEPVNEQPIKKEPEIIKPLNFKPKDNNHKSIKPISISSPKEETIILKKYQTSMIKNDGELSPSEAFNQGISRVAPTIKPMVIENTNQEIKGPVPIIKKDQIKDDEDEAPKRRNIHPLKPYRSETKKDKTEDIKK